MSFEDVFNRIIKLIGRTGDRMVILDRQSPAVPFVLMSLDSYENLNSSALAKKGGDNNEDLSLTEGDLADKINDEISNWKHQDEAQYLEEEFRARNPWKIPDIIKQKALENSQEEEKNNKE